MSRAVLPLSILLILVLSATGQRLGPEPGARTALLRARANAPEVIHVDPARGDDRNPGTEGRPKRSVSSAMALLPDPLLRSVTIKLAPGTYTDTGGVEMPPARLHLVRRMAPGISVDIVGGHNEKGPASILAWEGQDLLIDAREGQ